MAWLFKQYIIWVHILKWLIYKEISEHLSTFVIFSLRQIWFQLLLHVSRYPRAAKKTLNCPLPPHQQMTHPPFSLNGFFSSGMPLTRGSSSVPPWMYSVISSQHLDTWCCKMIEDFVKKIINTKYCCYQQFPYKLYIAQNYNFDQFCVIVELNFPLPLLFQASPQLWAELLPFLPYPDLSGHLRLLPALSVRNQTIKLNLAWSTIYLI